MAVNIFTGSTKSKTKSKSSSKTSSSNSTSMSSVANANKASLVPVGKSSVLSKVIGFAQKALPVAANLLPGPAGMIAKGITSVFNDPEWWQNVEGTGVTTNIPLTTVVDKRNNVGSTEKSVYDLRFSILEIDDGYHPTSGDKFLSLNMTPEMASKYLLPNIRKVLNAIPLQSPEAYASAMNAAANIYAIWQHLKKIEYWAANQVPFLPTMVSPAFPLMLTENASYLQSAIRRLEEILRAQIRLPHTLCEYLAWRYGRVYRTNDSAKAGYVVYSPIGIMSTSLSTIQGRINAAIAALNSSAGVTLAMADLFNTFAEHDYQVEIKPETQCHYDRKEFVLRTNLTADDGSVPLPANDFLLMMDSQLDNPTTFMSGTISTSLYDSREATDLRYEALFPVLRVIGYLYNGIPNGTGTTGLIGGLTYASEESLWGYIHLTDGVFDFRASNWANITPAIFERLMLKVTASKALDYYNTDLLVNMTNSENEAVTYYVAPLPLAIDTARVQNDVIIQEQQYAIANLLSDKVKKGGTYGKAETRVANDVAQLINTVTPPSVTAVVK